MSLLCLLRGFFFQEKKNTDPKLLVIVGYCWNGIVGLNLKQALVSFVITFKKTISPLVG